MAGLSRTLGIFGGFVAVVGAAFYPIYFRPLLMPEEYSGYLPEFYHVASRMNTIFSITLLGAVKMSGIFGLVFLVASFLLYFPEKEQSINRAGIVQEDIQPGGLKVWSDPFGRK